MAPNRGRHLLQQGLMCVRHRPVRVCALLPSRDRAFPALATRTAQGPGHLDGPPLLRAAVVGRWDMLLTRPSKHYTRAHVPRINIIER